MPNDSQNHLNNKWLPWKQNKRYLVHLTLSASLKSTPYSLQNFKFLRVRVLGITPPSPYYGKEGLINWQYCMGSNVNGMYPLATVTLIVPQLSKCLKFEAIQRDQTDQKICI